MLFTTRLRWLRERSGLSQKEMAEKLEISQQGYSHIETGRREPNLKSLWMIKHIFGESLDFIIGYHFEDLRAEQLYELYAEARTDREEVEDDLKYFESQMNEPGIDFQKYLTIVKNSRDSLKTNQIREEKAFAAYFEYISAIPGFEGEFATQEFWKNKYKSYKERDKQLYREFLDEYHGFVDSEKDTP